MSKQISGAGQAAMAARLQAQGARVQPPRTAAAPDPGIKGIYLDHILLGLQAFSTAIDELADVTTFHQDHFHAMGRAGDLMPKDAPYKGKAAAATVVARRQAAAGRPQAAAGVAHRQAAAVPPQAAALVPPW